jgi:hypothetical protein
MKTLIQQIREVLERAEQDIRVLEIVPVSTTQNDPQIAQPDENRRPLSVEETRAS